MNRQSSCKCTAGITTYRTAEMILPEYTDNFNNIRILIILVFYLHPEGMIRSRIAGTQ